MKCICGKEYRYEQSYITHLSKPACPIIKQAFPEDSDFKTFESWLVNWVLHAHHPPNIAALKSILRLSARAHPVAALPRGG
jgi:hypothetical protein